MSLRQRLLERNGVADRERAARLRAYLAGTDWYASRFAETGVPVPEDVRLARQAARDELDRLRGGER